MSNFIQKTELLISLEEVYWKRFVNRQKPITSSKKTIEALLWEYPLFKRKHASR